MIASCFYFIKFDDTSHYPRQANKEKFYEEYVK